MVTICPWKVYFDGSVCGQGCSIKYVIVSPRGVVQEMSERLEFKCTNNGTEYEALLAALEYVVRMEVKDVKVFGDSKLVVQQVSGKSQCLDGVLNQYWDRCAWLVDKLDTFCIEHIQREENQAMNRFTQQAKAIFSYNVSHKD
jgi:ribonuclease HI